MAYQLRRRAMKAQQEAQAAAVRSQAASPAAPRESVPFGPKASGVSIPEVLHSADLSLVDRWRRHPQESQGNWDGAPIPVAFTSEEVYAAVQQAAGADPRRGSLGGMDGDSFFIAEKVAEALESWSGTAWVRIPSSPGLPVSEFNLTDRIRHLRHLFPRHPDHRPTHLPVHDMARIGTTWDQHERMFEVSPEALAGKQFQPGFAFALERSNIAGAEANLRNIADRRVRAVLEENLRLARAQEAGLSGYGGADDEYGDDEEYGYADLDEPALEDESYGGGPYAPAGSGPPPGFSAPLNLTSFFPVTQVFSIKG